ncbi:hypothetical protein SE17_19175 [Kouleothrix aurantiaca]|uniref:Uncharacterized protein n=1 Tax=Kouleothrix aurantiaca TaxID=186479 RepID=A0A0P9CZ71_9CHLR|nr:hypothetical protein SE17_19175 [Kouleothrix aurantiaca]
MILFPTPDQTIIGGPQILMDRLRRSLAAKNVPEETIESVVAAYTAYGELTGIGNLLPLAQAVHETGWFRSDRWVISQNPAGLGATDDGAWGNVFDTPAAGILAQYAHLLAYALPNKKGSAGSHPARHSKTECFTRVIGFTSDKH